MLARLTETTRAAWRISPAPASSSRLSTSRSGGDFSTWWRSSIVRAEPFWPGGCRIRWMSGSVSGRWRRLLRGSASRRFSTPTGQPIHQRRLHRNAGGGRYPHLDGRARPLDRQRLHRAAVAQPEIRGHSASRATPTAARPEPGSPNGWPFTIEHHNTHLSMPLKGKGSVALEMILRGISGDAVPSA